MLIFPLSTTVSYEALSYAWGDSKTTESIEFENMTFPITATQLYSTSDLLMPPTTFELMLYASTEWTIQKRVIECNSWETSTDVLLGSLSG